MSRTISVIGLGYVGLPVAVAFAEAGFEVIGFDLNPDRIAELQKSFDRTAEVDTNRLANTNIIFTTENQFLQEANFHIIAVPTPIDDGNEPDLRALLLASEIVGKVLKQGDIVVYESTVYPGCTEEDCAPVLERASGLKSPEDFCVGYSPERINPGDRDHRLEKITKIVSAQTAAGLDIIAATYGAIIKAGIHRSPTIQTAEAAKIIENTQRDLNIALVNELAGIFDRLGIDTYDVLAAAKTKWNFLPFEPGLVGGHCIGVDPYYLTHKAIKHGINPQVILAGRVTNNAVAHRLAEHCRKWLEEHRRTSPRVAILGVTFKENVPDIRNSKVPEIYHYLAQSGAKVEIFDPLADPRELEKHHNCTCSCPSTILFGKDREAYDAILLTVPHDALIGDGWDVIASLAPEGVTLVMDLKGKLDRDQTPKNVVLWRP